MTIADTSLPETKAVTRTRAALRLAGASAGRALMVVRGAVSALGPFGVALLALYPVAIVITIALAGFMLTGRVTPM